MKLRAMALLGLMAAPAFSGERPDMLRFTNGDQLRGRFDGVRAGPVIQWLHDDLAAPAEFKTAGLHQLVLNEGKPPQPLRTLAYTELANHDRFPGSIVALDADKVTIETEYAGILHIPRDHVSMLAPNPMGGRIHYYGPFAGDDWKTMDVEQADDGKDNPPDPGGKNNDDDVPDDWIFNGSSWVWKGGDPKGALTRSSLLPERSVLRFDLSWRNRLSLAVAMHADFARPAPKDDDARQARLQRAFNTMDPVSLGRIFGNSHIIQFYSSYLSHVSTRVEEDGSISVVRGMRGNQNLRMPDSGRTRVELRSNRKTGEVALFIDDEFSGQWNMHDADEEAEKPAFTGAGIGFIAMSKDCPVRISDIVISEWNGMPDSARSLQVEDQDVVLMTNGTDRYAGKVGALGEDGIVGFEGRHGSFRLPLDEIAEIRFARNGLAAIPEPDAPAILARMGPIGAINGTPVGGTRDTIQLVNPSVGRIELSLRPVTLIDFNPSHISIDDWSNDF